MQREDGTVPIAGYCHECAEWVWVADDGSCPKGHSASRVSGLHDGEAGEPAATEASPSAAASGTRVGFLSDLTAAFAHTPAYSASWGPDTDMTVSSNPVDAMWGIGTARTEYAGAIKVSEVDRTIYFWEQLREQASGIALAAFDSEDYTTHGATPPGARERAVGPGSASWEWGYGTTRPLVEEVAARHGFAVRTVLSRRAASW
jgi:hypothetical protein